MIPEGHTTEMSSCEHSAGVFHVFSVSDIIQIPFNVGGMNCGCLNRPVMPTTCDLQYIVAFSSLSS